MSPALVVLPETGVWFGAAVRLLRPLPEEGAGLPATVISAPAIAEAVLGVKGALTHGEPAFAVPTELGICSSLSFLSISARDCRLLLRASSTASKSQSICFRMSCRPVMPFTVAGSASHTIFPAGCAREPACFSCAYVASGQFWLPLWSHCRPRRKHQSDVMQEILNFWSIHGCRPKEHPSCCEHLVV